METAEFDQFADEYYKAHERNIAVSGEAPEFFHEYKVRDARRLCAAKNEDVKHILDFGSGVGNSLPHFRNYFPDAKLTGVDVSERSLEIASERYPGQSDIRLITEQIVPVENDKMDLAFSACVFHHIDHAEHVFWLRELRRVCKIGGRLIIFEHNQLNPLTVHAVRTCEFDENAHLISSGAFKRRLIEAGWKDVAIRYRIFFPSFLGSLRPLESWMTWLPLGAQYYVTASK